MRMVPSDERTLSLVRSAVSAEAVSVRPLYLAEIGPSSAVRSAGIKPPCSMPFSIAKSRAARSAPVWPPEMILSTLLRKHFLQTFESFLLHGFVDGADLFHETAFVDYAD